MEFANKEYLFLLLLMIPYVIWYLMYRKKTEPTMRMSDTFAFRNAPKSWKVRLMPLSMLLRLRDNKPIITHIRIVKRLLPHQKAMQEIEQIKADKMVASENSKEYYTKLTDTLRKYIEERYGFNAMEMTSSEIIEKLTATQDEKGLSELRHLFLTADLVKFAKYSTLINENDMNLVNAIEFINQTKLENVPVEETIQPQLTEEDQRTQKERRVLKTAITAVSVVCVLLFAYVVYTLYLLLN